MLGIAAHPVPVAIAIPPLAHRAAAATDCNALRPCWVHGVARVAVATPPTGRAGRVRNARSASPPAPIGATALAIALGSAGALPLDRAGSSRPACTAGAATPIRTALLTGAAGRA